MMRQVEEYIQSIYIMGMCVGGNGQAHGVRAHDTAIKSKCT